jgi:hypothetical protein
VRPSVVVKAKKKSNWARISRVGIHFVVINASSEQLFQLLEDLPQPQALAWLKIETEMPYLDLLPPN